jgi:hypothetical protein
MTDSSVIPLHKERSLPERDGAQLLFAISEFLGRFVAYPSEHAQIAHTLWIAHTHLMEAWDSSPRIAFLSPEPGSGKTRALELTASLSPNAIEAVNMSSAYIFRRIGADIGLPTLLIDEVDALFAGKSQANEEIRALLNAGHRRGAVVGRCVIRGKEISTEESSAFCAVALAGLGWLPDTLMSRSIIIRMRRRAPNEAIEPYRHRDHASQGEILRERLDAWASTLIDHIARARPAMPPGVEDRAADCWEPLLAIADAAGGHWPDIARDAAVALVASARDANPSLGIRLLDDLWQVFGEHKELPTEQILSLLHGLPESPWGSIKGKPLDDRGLAVRLRKYEIKPKVLKAFNRRGYRREDLADSWQRYLPPTVPEDA